MLEQTPQFDRSFRVEKQQETDSEHFSSFECHKKIDLYYFVMRNRFPCAIDYTCKVHRKLVIVDVGIVAGSVVVEGVLPVDVAGSREVELFGIHEVQVLLGLITCEGCLVVRTDHGPQAEVAQVFGLELLVELGGRHLEGLEEEQRNGEEKETGEENNHHTTHKCTCMDGMTRARQLEPRCDTM